MLDSIHLLVVQSLLQLVIHCQNQKKKQIHHCHSVARHLLAMELLVQHFLFTIRQPQAHGMIINGNIKALLANIGA
jgi:hypothetical protein